MIADNSKSYPQAVLDRVNEILAHVRARFEAEDRKILYARLRFEQGGDPRITIAISDIYAADEIAYSWNLSRFKDLHPEGRQESPESVASLIWTLLEEDRDSTPMPTPIFFRTWRRFRLRWRRFSRHVEATTNTLTEHLVAWLRRIVPDEIQVDSTESGFIELRDSSGGRIAFSPGALLDQPGISIREGLQIAIHSVLNGVQDFVIEELREPWPATPQGKDLALPRVELTDEECFAGYFSDGKWVLQMPPLRLK